MFETYTPLASAGNANAMLDKLFGKNPNKDIIQFYITREHRCPTCNRAVVKADELLFLQETGECLSCDHVRSDIVYSNDQLEYIASEEGWL